MTTPQLCVQSSGDFFELAGNTLQQLNHKDITAPDLFELTGISEYGFATASGLTDRDYQNLSTLSLGHKQLHQLQHVNKVPIPAEILEHFKHIKCHCMMGLFPEIGRAWLTIDSEIYIWTYESTRDVAYYDGLQHIIVSVGLVKPKPNVFINDVKYLLILTTPIEIIILGVTFNDTTKTISSPTRSMQGTTTFEEMQLMNQPIFVIPTDNVALNVIKGSQNGRIFLGGRDGCLYEISYQAESTWFGKRCKKINHSQSIVSYIVPAFLKVFSEVDAIIQIAIDNSRQLLYTLTEKGAIEVWDMGVDVNNMQSITRATQTEISNCAINIIKNIDASIFKGIKIICPLTTEDSSYFNLIAVTHAGVRLYFATSPPKPPQRNVQEQQQQQQQQQQQLQSQQLQQQQMTQNTQQQMFLGNSTQQTMSGRTTPNNLPVNNEITEVDKKPIGLYLLHVRLPPGYTPNATTNKPRQVHSAYYNDGTLLLVSTPQQEQDLLWSISSAPFANRQFLTESTTVLTLDGIVWSLAEVAERNKATLPSLLRKAQTPKRIVLLTNQGAHIIALLKPVDILQQLLLACQGPQHDAVKAYFQVQTEREACICCLLIACSEQYRGTDLAMWAIQAFMIYGGEPVYQHQTMMMSTVGTRPTAAGGMSPQMYMSTPLPYTMNTPLMSRNVMPNPSPTHTPQQYPLSPITGQQIGTYGGAGSAPVTEIPHLVYSAKHDALYLYVARLLRPIWQLRCVNAQLCSSLSQHDCRIILEDLFAIRAFLDANSISELSNSMRSFNNQINLTNGYASQYLHNSTASLAPQEQRNLTEKAQIEEKRSMTALNQLLKHICEVIGLWKILGEHQFPVLTEQLKPDEKEKLLTCTFRDLTLSGTEMCTMLIVGLINSYLCDCASVSAISAKLRDVCPNLYRHEDAVTYKATELLMLAKNCTDIEERQDKLTTALQLCKDAAPHLPLQSICQQFNLVNFYEGVIELAATCAAKLDPEQLGIHYYNNDEPVEDTEGYAAYKARMTCYQEVRNMLDSIKQSINGTHMEHRLACKDTKEQTSPRTQINKVLHMAMQVNDPLLHVAVYEWMLTHDMRSELLALTQSTLGEFLRRNVVRNEENLQLIDLLWKYYEKNSHHAKAARILDNLACNKSDAIMLEQRIEYLARAVMCMRNDAVGYSVANGVLLKELEDKLEIARVQKTVLNAISALAQDNRNAANAVKELNRTLFDITQLYKNFAEPFALWECKLTILNCSHHNDPLLIESVWTQIINRAIEAPGSTNERCTRLFTKIENLVKEFGESGNCFPLAFLIRELEIKACHLRFPEGIVPDKLVAMQMDIELLMEYYSRMISMNERIWTNEGNEWHLVQSAIRLITLLVQSSHTLFYRSKRRIIGKAQDIVSMCLNLCYQKPDTDRLQQSLKELQCRLQRALA